MRIVGDLAQFSPHLMLFRNNRRSALRGRESIGNSLKG